MNNINVNNTSLLIAGPFSKNGLLTVEKYFNKFNLILVSTYKNDDCEYLKKLKDKYSHLLSIKIVENNLPKIYDIHNSQNIYYQCFSVLKGLEIMDTDFVIKLRSDEYYSKLDTIIETLPFDKVSTNNIFIRDVSYKPFHFSDHLIVGRVRVIENTYNDLKCYIEMHSNNDYLQILNNTTPAETKIFLFMFFNITNVCLLDWHNLSKNQIYKYMKKYFYIFEVDKLYPYSVKSSIIGDILNYKKFVRDDVLLNLRYSKNIDDLRVKSSFNKLLFRIMYKLKKVLL